MDILEWAAGDSYRPAELDGRYPKTVVGVQHRQTNEFRTDITFSLTINQLQRCGYTKSSTWIDRRSVTLSQRADRYLHSTRDPTFGWSINHLSQHLPAVLLRTPTHPRTVPKTAHTNIIRFLSSLPSLTRPQPQKPSTICKMGRKASLRHQATFIRKKKPKKTTAMMSGTKDSPGQVPSSSPSPRWRPPAVTSYIKSQPEARCYR